MELNQGLQKDIAYLIRMEHGVQTPELTLQNASGSCRDSALAAGAAAAPPRPGGALRLGLPDPAEERRQVARRPERHRGRLHRPARLVRGLPAGRRLDRPRPDVGPLRRRRPHPARLLARAVVGGADQRHARPVRDDLRAPHVGAARLGSAARHLAVQRAAVGRDRRARQGGRRRSAPARRSPDARRRADLRLGRRPRRRRMEHRGDGPDQARPERRADGAPARALRQRRPRPLRPGQVVSGRAAAALVAQSLLAPRRRADLARPGAAGERARRSRRDRGAGARVPASPGAAPRRRPPQRLRRLRGRRLLPLARRQAADQRRADRFAPRRQGRAQPPAPGVRARPRRAGRLRAADRRRRAAIRSAGARRPGTCATTTASWSPAIRRSAFACRSIRCRGRAPATCPGSIRPTPTSSCRRFPAMPARRTRATRPAWHASGESAAPKSAEHETPSGTHDVGSDAADAARGARRAGGRRIGRLRRPHRDQRRGAPRPALHLHAADVGARGLPRARRRRRGDRARRCACR